MRLTVSTYAHHVQQKVTGTTAAAAQAVATGRGARCAAARAASQAGTTEAQEPFEYITYVCRLQFGKIEVNVEEIVCD